MKILIDTNVLISAALFPAGTAAQAYAKATKQPYKIVICDYCVQEFKRIVRKKFPKRISVANAFLAEILTEIKLVRVPRDDSEIDERIRDPKDRPILQAALKVKVDVILTGDKDFLESDIQKPRMLSPAEFIKAK